MKTFSQIKQFTFEDKEQIVHPGVNLILCSEDALLSRKGRIISLGLLFCKTLRGDL